MKTILFYTPGACSLAGIVALEWLGEPFELCRVEKEEQPGAHYRKINPRGQVPALRVDGRILVESNAILAHIADRKPVLSLLPENGTWERDIANQWLAYLASNFHASFWPYFNPHRYAKDETMHAAIREMAIESTRRELVLIDNHLQGRDFVMGTTLTVLDGYLHAMDRWANKMVDMPKEFPNIWRHQKALTRNPAVRFAVAIEHGEAVPVSGAFEGHVALDTLTV